MMATPLAGIARFEREPTAERVRSGLAAAKARGPRCWDAGPGSGRGAAARGPGPSWSGMTSAGRQAPSAGRRRTASRPASRSSPKAGSRVEEASPPRKKGAQATAAELAGPSPPGVGRRGTIGPPDRGARAPPPGRPIVLGRLRPAHRRHPDPGRIARAWRSRALTESSHPSAPTPRVRGRVAPDRARSPRPPRFLAPAVTALSTTTTRSGGRGRPLVVRGPRHRPGFASCGLFGHDVPL